MSSSVPPPAYLDAPAAYPDAPSARLSGDDPDGFKYDVDVALCDRAIRHMFIRKVYALLSLQLTTTLVAGTIIYTSPEVREWCLTHMWPLWTAIGLLFVFLIGAMAMRRLYPWNVLALAGFTLCESYLVGVATSTYDLTVVIQAVAITLFLFAGLTAFAFQTKYDLVLWEGVLSGGLWLLIGVGFVMAFVPYLLGVLLVYLIIGAVIFSGYILVDTQRLMTQFHPEDEVAAAVSLYLDVINLFLHILRILSLADSRD